MSTTPDPPRKRAPRGSVSQAVMDHLTASPGKWYRPVEVATATGLTSHQAAQTMLALAERGKLLRQRDGRSNSRYAYLPLPDESGAL